ncbi:MAG TPA: hypothetical protein VGR35_20900 [Tepidisphaeraceae bacterium]|nr:hypothetical protein [Tepidisphaeraceae bacterium]
MKRLMFCAAFAVLPILGACDREVATESDVDVKDDGTVVKEETTVSETADGEIRKEETKSVDRPDGQDTVRTEETVKTTPAD